MEQPLDEVDLRLRERRVEPHASRSDAVAGGGFDPVVAGGTREVGVVEDDAARTRRECVVERTGKLAQRSAALVAVEPHVLAVLTGEAALARAGDAHDQDDLAVARACLWARRVL